MSGDDVTFQIVELNFQLNKIESWEKFFFMIEHSDVSHTLSFFLLSFFEILVFPEESTNCVLS